MLILDPDMNGCHIYIIKPILFCGDIDEHSFSCYIKGKPEQVVLDLLPRITREVYEKNFWGNKVKTKKQTETIYLDIKGIGSAYVDLFRIHNIAISPMYSRNIDIVLPKQA